MATLSSADQQALIDAAIGAHVSEAKQYLRGSRTQTNISRANGQFEHFLRRFKGHAAATWHSCSPELVLTYLRTEVASRCGRSGGDLAASTLRQHVSNLSMCFGRRGLTKPWDEVTSQGNPVLSQLVRDHVEVIERRQHLSGQRERSAPPVPADLVRQLLGYLDQALAEATASHNRLEQFRCARDASLVALLWHSCRRAADLLRLTWGHVYAQGRDKLVTELWAGSSVIDPLPGLLITADVLKNSHRSRPLSICVPAATGSDVQCCAVNRLQQLHGRVLALGECPTGPIFCAYRTVQPPRSALTSSGFANRFQTLIEAVFRDGPAAHFTVHGVRRGRMQHEGAQGGTLQDILRLAGISTESVGLVYLDRGRHLP